MRDSKEKNKGRSRPIKNVLRRLKVRCPACNKELPEGVIQAIQILDFAQCPKCYKHIKIEGEKIYLYIPKEVTND